MSSTRDQRIRRAPSKSPKKTDKSKTGSPKASGSAAKDTNFYTGTNTTSSTLPVSKLSLGGNLLVGPDLPMTAAFRGPSIDTDLGGQQISSLRVTRLRNTKSLQVTKQLRGILRRSGKVSSQSRTQIYINAKNYDLLRGDHLFHLFTLLLLFSLLLQKPCIYLEKLNMLLHRSFNYKKYEFLT